MTLYLRRNLMSPSATAVVLAILCLGCRGSRTSSVERIYHNPYPLQRTLAVIPFRNLSGTDYLDVMAVTDEFATELQMIDRIQVVPVNRVLAALVELGMDNVASPQDAIALAQNLGADGVIVGAVTRYDPYQPPKVGMLVQMYSQQLQAPPNAQDDALHVNPGQMATQPKRLEMGKPTSLEPQSGVARIFDADQDAVIERIKRYARDRSGKRSPTGWKTYLTTRKYLQFVSHEVIGELLAQEARCLQKKNSGELP